MGRPRIDLVGKKFGRLTVLEYGGNNNDNHATWKCVCECGTVKYVIGNVLVRGNTKSCGCLRKENARAMWYGGPKRD